MASRLIFQRTANFTNKILKNQVYLTRGYASEMSFTFASPNEVCGSLSA